MLTVEDANILQVVQIGKLLNSLDCDFDFEQTSVDVDGFHLYTITADVTGKSARVYKAIDLLS